MTLEPTINDDLQQFLSAHRVQVFAPRQRMVELKAVPVGDGFSKPRTNLLLWGRSVWQIFVDDDLTYAGDDPQRSSLLVGARGNRWQELTLPRPLTGDANDALLYALELLGSPLKDLFEQSVQTPCSLEDQLPEETSVDFQPDWCGRLLDVQPFDNSSFEPTTAQAKAISRIQLAALRVESPTCPVLVGPSGGGKSTAARMAAGELVKNGVVRNVFEISGASLNAGVSCEAERDERLTDAFAIADSATNSLIIIEQFDLLILSSKIVQSLTADLIDRRVRVIGVTQPAFQPRRLRGHGPLLRRLEMIYLNGASPSEMQRVIEKRLPCWPVARQIEVVPSAVTTAVALSLEESRIEPAGSIGLMESVLVDARKNGLNFVGPDEVFHVHSQIHD